MSHAVMLAERLGPILPLAAQSAGPTTTDVGVVFIILGVVTCATNRFQGRLVSTYTSEFRKSSSGRFRFFIGSGIVGIFLGIAMVVYGQVIE